RQMKLFLRTRSPRESERARSPWLDNSPFLRLSRLSGLRPYLYRSTRDRCILRPRFKRRSLCCTHLPILNIRHGKQWEECSPFQFQKSSKVEMKCCGTFNATISQESRAQYHPTIS